MPTWRRAHPFEFYAILLVVLARLVGPLGQCAGSNDYRVITTAVLHSS